MYSSVKHITNKDSTTATNYTALQLTMMLQVNTKTLLSSDYKFIFTENDACHMRHACGVQV